MNVRLVALATAAVLAAGCGGDSKPASPEKVAVEWLQAKAAYDGGKEWDLEAPTYRAGITRKNAAERRTREKAEECPNPNASGCLFRKGVKFTAIRQRRDGQCVRVVVRAEAPQVEAQEGAVAVIRVGKDWKVRDWVPGFPDGEFAARAARDCGVS